MKIYKFSEKRNKLDGPENTICDTGILIKNFIFFTSLYSHYDKVKQSILSYFYSSRGASNIS